MVAPAGVVVNEPWEGLRANGSVGVLIIKGELNNSHVGGNMWGGASETNSWITG